MDVKGAKALSERLAQAARDADRESVVMGSLEHRHTGRRRASEGMAAASSDDSIALSRLLTHLGLAMAPE